MMKIGVIGLGTMGAGIVQVALQAGHEVFAYDANPSITAQCKTYLDKNFAKLIEKEKCTLTQVDLYNESMRYVSEISMLSPCELVIEAIVEKLEIKKSVFAELEKSVSESCIIATNTSSLSVTAIAAGCTLPQRVIGIHFFNPAPLMALVEIIPAIQTSNSVLEQSISIVNGMNKKTVVAKDTPGFIVNRIARPYYGEAIRMYEEGIQKETIDAAMEAIGFKMGPFQLMDMIGHDVNYVVTETVWQSMFYDDRYKPSFSQKRLLEAGWLGRKSGKGFYDYSQETMSVLIDPTQFEKIQTRILYMLFNEAGDAAFLNIASEEDIETAMTKGVNYPKGLLTWASEYGYASVVNGLDTLYHYYHEDRYRCSPFFRNKLR
jgi:3-hydroxybutyryl-CoA dehydrogenase